MRVFFILFFGIFFLGCSPKIEYTKSEAYAFVIKNRDMAIIDTGFIKYSPHHINLQIYKTAEPIFELDLGKLACINGVCLEKSEFNRRFFSFSHYPEIMKDILNKHPIYEKKEMKKNLDGFKQVIKTENFDLVYEVTNKTSYFKDRKNRVLLKLKRLE